MSNQDIYARVTDQIIASLEKGVVPWKRPWRARVGNTTLHTNLHSKKPYRGVNQFLCEISAMNGGFTSPYWVSFKQAKEKGGSVRKGEKGTLVVFWKIMRKQSRELDKNGQPKVATIPLLKHYFVWNVDQCDGVRVPEVTEEEVAEFDPIESAQDIIDGMPQRPTLIHRGNRAFYRPSDDSVTLPEEIDFTSPGAYYSTAFHELVHSTGHESRLGRVTEWGSFGTDPYAKEELVAEMGAAMLCAMAGIETQHEQSASYCASWVRQFESDPKLIVSAAGQSQKAADFVIGFDAAAEAEKADKELAVA